MDKRPRFASGAKTSYAIALPLKGDEQVVVEGEMTIVDPEALTAPWTVKQAYARAEGLDHLVYDTFSNDRTTLEDGVYAILPPEGGE